MKTLLSSVAALALLAGCAVQTAPPPAPPSAPPVATGGIEYGSMAQSNPFGPTASALAVGAKLQRISMPIDGNPGGFSNDAEIATAAASANAGVHVEIDLFWSTTAAVVGSGPIASDAAYVAGITSTLKKVAATGAIVDLVIIENEETESHDTSTVAQVIQKYNDAIPAIHALGFKVADSGLTGHSLNHWFAKSTNSDAELARTVALAQYIATSQFDYCNVHFYPDMNNPAVEIPWLMAQEKRPCVIGEMGTYDNGAANTLAELNIGAAVHAPMIIYWNQQSQTQPKAIALIDDQGVLGPNGVAFKARATALAPPVSAPVAQ